jgi:predicted DNA-binding transcriptional regulator AlpA
MSNYPQSPVADKNKLLSPRDVSEILGVSEETLSVWRCNKTYDIPYIKVGRLVKYKQSDIDSFIESRRQVIHEGNF